MLNTDNVVIDMLKGEALIVFASSVIRINFLTSERRHWLFSKLVLWCYELVCLLSKHGYAAFLTTSLRSDTN